MDLLFQNSIFLNIQKKKIYFFFNFKCGILIQNILLENDEGRTFVQSSDV